MDAIYESYRNSLNEGFINTLPGDTATKERWADEVWDMLKSSYAPHGGVKGSGFSSKEDMIKNIPMWKLSTVKGKLVAVVMYKDKAGRKAVAGATDGSKDGILKYKEMVKAELSRSFGEKSKAALSVLMKIMPWERLENFTLTPSEAAKALGKNVTPIKSYRGELPADAKVSLDKFPQLEEYAYLRQIAGTATFKVAFGTPGLEIK